MSEPAEPRFHEPGARWRTVALGPVLCVVVLAVELLTGPVVHWVSLPVIALVLSGFAYVTVVAARRHVSVELTAATLRLGTEELPLEEIDAVLPPADPRAREPERWETARPLGELSNVPRGRTAVGLRLRGGALVRAWAKDHERLRSELGTVLAERADPPLL
ncbi:MULTISPECIES: hypothetical protein [unclassified Rhodococcus (in: high G+C Gram-positive bacteria)]|uniref:hypothetical protein n=1 Tax=unclassified Rhodococcus (in: high G+C Gram-positive bacteria) TaxID=192944 RepID=UPI000928B40E|nr:hypothetical protein [Rhodococcus sp. M8]OLL17035.1 hypothetical protein BKE56_027365 [Rhodococcus sp. M8]QPG47108.1 hypothetical protein ISO16_09000 [Rhodococcus sp. M8]